MSYRIFFNVLFRIGQKKIDNLMTISVKMVKTLQTAVKAFQLNKVNS